MNEIGIFSCTGTPRKLGSKTQYNPIEGCQNKEALKVCIGRALVRKDSKKGQ